MPITIDKILKKALLHTHKVASILGILPQAKGGWGEDSTSRWNPATKKLTIDRISLSNGIDLIGASNQILATAISIEASDTFDSYTTGSMSFSSDDICTFYTLVALTFYGTPINFIGKTGIGVANPTATLHLKAGSTAASSAPIKLTSGTVMTAAEAGAIEFTTDTFFATITTGTARKGIVTDDGARLTSGKYPKASTNGRLIDGPTPLAGTKVYYVSDTSGGAVTRKLTFTDGILTAEV